jgi:hypothetical protein
MYFRFILLIDQFAKIFVEKTNSQTNKKSQWCRIFKNGGSSCLGLTTGLFNKGKHGKLRPN